MSAAVGACALAGPLAARPLTQTAKPDEIFRVDRRSGKTVMVKGRIEQHGLERVMVAKGESQPTRIDTSDVVEIVFGDVPPSYSEGLRYVERGDFENAVARFRVAAGDAAARPIVQGRARLRAAEALLAWGASDPTRFREAAEEAGRFLASFPEDRNVPFATALQGRCQVLAGDPTTGAATLKALFEAGQAARVGYPKLMTLQAGFDAAMALLAAGKSTEGRAQFDALGSTIAGVTEDGLSAADKAQLANLRELATMGSGWVSIAEGQGDRAESFFRGLVERQTTGAGRTAARLGLGEALLLQSKFRAAELTLASASALCYTSADFEARALVGLAQAHLGLGEAAEAKRALERVLRDLGTTPAAARAAELLKTL